MKKLTVFLCSLALVFSVVGVAGAVSYTWTDERDFNPDQFVGWYDTFSYDHDITDGADGFQGLLMGGDDILYNYSLTVRLRDDDNSRWDMAELAFIDQPGLLGDGYYNFSYYDQDFGWSAAGYIALSLNGTLGVNITSHFGDFYVDYSHLVAHGDNGSGSGPAPVPEPSTILLMGAGLLGLVAVGRRKFNRKE